MSSPLPTTPGDIIALALKMANVLGVGQTASAEDANDAFNLLNMMMAQWQRRRYIVYQLVTTSKVATGALSYTVGPGGDFNIPRPAKLESAFFRMQSGSPLPVDYNLTILRAKEDYNRIGIKTLNAFPEYAFYDSGNPLGNLYIWPVPNNQYEIFITVFQQLQQFNTLNDVITLPPEYKAAIMWNLALELYPMYGLPVNEVVAKKAEASLRIVHDTNAQIPRLNMPPALQNRGGNNYNVYGDAYVGTSN
jgi:hypothetical protein